MNYMPEHWNLAKVAFEAFEEGGRHFVNIPDHERQNWIACIGAVLKAQKEAPSKPVIGIFSRVRTKVFPWLTGTVQSWTGRQWSVRFFSPDDKSETGTFKDWLVEPEDLELIETRIKPGDRVVVKRGSAWFGIRGKAVNSYQHHARTRSGMTMWCVREDGGAELSVPESDLELEAK